jgi:hypothetical protein
MVEAEAARRTGDAMRKVIGELRPEQVELLQRCGAYGEPVSKIARQKEKRYKTVLDAFHDLLGLCGARLGTLLGSRELPPWHPELSGRVFEDPPEPANDDGHGQGT